MPLLRTTRAFVCLNCAETQTKIVHAFCHFFFGANVQRIRCGPPPYIKPRSIIVTIDMKAFFLRFDQFPKSRTAFPPYFVVFLFRMQSGPLSLLEYRVENKWTLCALYSNCNKNGMFSAQCVRCDQRYDKISWERGIYVNRYHGILRGIKIIISRHLGGTSTLQAAVTEL